MSKKTYIIWSKMNNGQSFKDTINLYLEPTVNVLIYSTSKSQKNFIMYFFLNCQSFSLHFCFLVI